MADRLVATLAEHRAVYTDHDDNSDYWAHYGCVCGELGPERVDLGHKWHAEHLALVVRRHLRTAPVITAAPDDDRRTYDPPAEIPGS